MAYKIADQRNKYMGLNNKVCSNPVYWCRSKQIWLSEEDTQKKRCFNKLSADMLEVKKCNNIERRKVGS